MRTRSGRVIAPEASEATATTGAAAGATAEATAGAAAGATAAVPHFDFYGSESESDSESVSVPADSGPVTRREYLELLFRISELEEASLERSRELTLRLTSLDKEISRLYHLVEDHGCESRAIERRLDVLDRDLDDIRRDVDRCERVADAGSYDY